MEAVNKGMEDEDKVFRLILPKKLKTVELDFENKIFCINGEDIGHDCMDFSLTCNKGEGDYLTAHMNLNNLVQYANYDFKGNRTLKGIEQKEEAAQ